MKCVELAMALLAGDLIANGVGIDPESGEINLLMGKQMEPPTNDGNEKLPLPVKGLPICSSLCML